MKSAMENALESRRQTRPRVGVTHDDAGMQKRAVEVVVTPGVPRAGELACQNFVSLPAWFGSAKACAVLRLKAKAYVLVSDERGVQRVASLEQLAAVPADRGIAGCATSFGPAVGPATPVDEALELMDAHATDHVGVITGGVVIGVLSRNVATAALAGATHPTTRGCYPNAAHTARLAA